MNKDEKKLTGILEAVLFAHGEPLSFKKLSKTLKKSEDEIKKAAEELKSGYQDENSGLTLVFHKNSIKLVSSPAAGIYVEKLIKEEMDENLSPASLETLTLVLYLAPVSRAEIDYIRGVNSGFMLRALMMRGLLERKPDPKRPYIYIYEPTFKLLEFIGISKAEEIPEYEKYHNILKKSEDVITN